MKPIMPFDYQEPFDEECKVVWWSRLDGRYQIEVHRVDNYKGKLHIFDHQDDDKLLFSEDVRLSYGAMFGPDVSDVETFINIATDFVDNQVG